MLPVFEANLHRVFGNPAARRSGVAGVAVAIGLLAGCSLPPELAGGGLRRSAPGPGGTASLPAEQTDGPAVLPTLLRSGLVPPAVLKIGLAVAQEEVSIQVAAPGQAGGVPLQPGRTYRIRRAGGDILLSDGTATLLRSPPPLVVTGTAPGALGSNGRRYRGSFEAIAAPDTADRVTLIDAVAPEDYLYGVVPVEMATSWPPEALRAQAVAARTYAFANLGRRAKLGFDLFDTTADQVYRGYSVEHADTSAAVDATRGQVLTWQGRPISAFFHAASGGETDDAGAVWGQDLPYIRGVRDLDPSPHAEWTATYPDADLTRALASLGADVGRPERLEVTTWTPHGRARWLAAAGSAGAATVDANALRLKLGQKSTRYKLSREGGAWKFVGGGWGHGLGLSQWGARAYAAQGEGYREILARYYFQAGLVETAR